MTDPRYFTRVDATGEEATRYEVFDRNWLFIGCVWSAKDGGPGSHPTWTAELEGESLGTTKGGRMKAAQMLGVARTVPHYSVRRGRVRPPRIIDHDDVRTFLTTQPLTLFSDAMPAGSGDYPTAKADRRKAAQDILAAHAATLDAAGVTAKVGKDGFVHMSPVALERLLALVEKAA